MVFLIIFFFLYIAVPLDQLLKDPAEFKEFLFNKTNLSPRVISELLSSTVNVQKVSTCMLLLEAVSNFGMQHILGLSHWYYTTSVNSTFFSTLIGQFRSE